MNKQILELLNPLARISEHQTLPQTEQISPVLQVVPHDARVEVAESHEAHPAREDAAPLVSPDVGKSAEQSLARARARRDAQHFQRYGLQGVQCMCI